jgi:phage portal protein BeeE
VQSQYSGLLQFAQFNQRSQTGEIKAVSNQSPADFLAGEDVASQDNVLTFYRRVPWLFRAVEMRADAVSSAPFRIMRGETEVDHSATWQDTTGLLPEPVDLLWQIEAALTLWGTAYLWRERNRVKRLPLRYIVPVTVEPEIDETAGLQGFWRTLGAGRKWATPDDMVYLWKPDPTVELGPPTISPVIAAMSSAGVLFAIDAFAQAFVSRGAIKATLLTVEGNPTEEEKKRLANFPVGQGLFFAGQNHVHIQIIASQTETGLISTNPTSNNRPQPPVNDTTTGGYV